MSDTSRSMLFDTALQSYEEQTGMRLIDHPLARQLDNCHSVDSVMDILQHQARATARAGTAGLRAGRYVVARGRQGEGRPVANPDAGQLELFRVQKVRVEEV